MAALDDQIRETVNRLLDSMRSRLESDLAACQDELVVAAQEASARIAAEAADSAKAEVRREADGQLSELRESAAREASEHARAAEEQRALLAAEVAALQRQLEDAREDSERRLEESRRQLDDSHQAIDAAREEIEALKREVEAAHKQIDTTRDDVEATLRDIETVRRESDGARHEVARLIVELRSREERAAEALRLPDAVRTLDRASSFAEVLETLALRAGGEAGRAAVFLVKGDRLRDWRTVGFDRASDAQGIDISVSESGLMAEAVHSGERVQGGAAPEFARTDEPRAAAAWPVSVGGSVVAVLYADGPAADKPDEPYWPAFLDVLARHAGRVLEGITIRQAAGLMLDKRAGVSSASVGHQSSGSIQ